ncbi:MAG: hypothetical protein ACNI28_09725 [Arcobacter sp.]|uniref:hypothetical protein n=1 Tax=Arcobacter sp. TaxID=1872629 RepID=UPI003B00DAAF
MLRFFMCLWLFLSISYCEENTVMQQNVLYVTNMIKTEEKIAQAYEDYLLTEFEIPTISKLVTNGYLGENFTLKNRMGGDVNFNDENSLSLKYAISNTHIDQYLKDLYNRDLHRKKTAVFSANSGTSSYVVILLSKEGQNIYNILHGRNIINKTCNSTLKNSYCNNSINTIRWYNENRNWIEYSKRNFETSNVTVEKETVLSDSKLNNLPLGTYIRVENAARYVKVLDNKILKVE